MMSVEMNIVEDVVFMKESNVGVGVGAEMGADN